MNDFMRRVYSDLCGKEIIVIGTNRRKLLEFIKDRFDVPNSPKCTVHSNTRICVHDECVKGLTLSEILEYVNKYDEVIFYSTHHNTRQLLDNMNKQLSGKIIQVPTQNLSKFK